MPIIGTPATLLVPKIVYGSSTLNFTFPPVQKPGTDDIEAEREDSLTLTGLKQSIHIRTDEFFTLQMDYVPMSDLANWDAFLRFALEGFEFDYYPDSTNTTHFACTLEETKWLPKYTFRTFAKFSLRLRKV